MSVRVEAGFLKPAGKGVFPNEADPPAPPSGFCGC